MFRNRIRTYFERRDCRVALTVVSPSEAPVSRQQLLKVEPQPAGDNVPQNRQFQPQDAQSRPRDDAWLNFSI